MPPLPVCKLINPIQHYAWGSRESIAGLQGRRVPSDEPEAELWIGDHPRAPSLVETPDGESLPLPRWIEANRDAVLGPGASHLPYLVKVLAAARSLSLQVHPDADRARTGWQREKDAEVGTEARCYPDPHAKHELLIALTRFEALCGFRDDDAVLAATSSLPALGGLVNPGAPSPVPRALRLLGALAGLRAAQRAALLAELDRFARRGDCEDAVRVGRLRAEHPEDPLAAAPLFLNTVVLEPGDALVVRPGTVHTYLHGTGVEVMTRSDDVVRAGLTPKHVDAEELMAVALPLACAPEIQRASAGGAPPAIDYATGCDAFRVRALRLGEPVVSRPGGRVAVVLCVEGAATLRAGRSALTLGPGEAALVPADCEGFQLERSAQAERRTSRVFEVSSR